MVSTPGVHAAMAPAAASTADEEEEGREELRVKLWSPSSDLVWLEQPGCSLQEEPETKWIELHRFSNRKIRGHLRST